MIYECLQCKAPQQPGAVACPHCGTRFDDAVPDDAAAAPPPPPLPLPQAPPVPPPDLAEGHAPRAPQWVMPETTEPPNAGTVRETRSFPRTALLVATVAGLVAIVVLLYFLFNVGQTPADIAPAPAQAPASAPAQGVAAPPPSPVVLPPAPVSSAARGGPAQAAPVGRWMSKALDFYEFDASGSGSRGNASSGKPPDTFQWAMVNNQLTLALGGNGGTEKVPFSYGPGSETLNLRQPNGSYLEFTRQGQAGATSPAASGSGGTP